MKALLFCGGLIAGFISFVAWGASKTVIHEAISAMIVIVAAVLLGSAGIIGAIEAAAQRLSTELKKAVITLPGQ